RRIFGCKCVQTFGKRDFRFCDLKLYLRNDEGVAMKFVGIRRVENAGQILKWKYIKSKLEVYGEVNYEKNRGKDEKDDFNNCSSCFLYCINIWWNNDIWKIPNE
ncbi:MAG: hypothetical protein PUG06_08230, partial [Blautia sp.]